MSSRLRMPLTVTYSKRDLLTVALVAAMVAAWATVAGAPFSVRLLLASEAIFFASYLAGSLVAGVPALAVGLLFDLPLRLLSGYAIVNTSLLVLAWLSPLGIVANFTLVLLSVALAFFTTAERRERHGSSAGQWAIALGVVAATLWCQDSIRPLSEVGGQVLIRPWIDGFYHAVHVRIFAASHGAASIEDFRLSGLPARPYHYGMYLLPAFLKQASGIHSWVAFAGVLAPLGVLLTGLAAYALFGSLWGPEPGLAAAAALLLLPDGAEQGMQNTFMSYHWLSQISPSATYGLALLAVAWLLVIRGCAQGSWLQLFVGWGTAGVVSLYKFHFVIASSLLLLLVPAIFFRGRSSPRMRALWAAAACGVYALILALAQRVPGVPLIRFDGSSVGEILRLVETFAKPGVLREFITQHTGAASSTGANLVFGVPYIFCSILGVFAPLLVVLVWRLRRRTEPLYLLFPLLVLVNFLGMFFGLALDFESSTPDELSHRPLLIVYFFVVAWLGGALGLLLQEARGASGWARRAIIAVAAVSLCVPALFGPGVQRLWATPGFSFVRLPVAVLRVAEYLRSHGGVEDVFQDSQFDRNYILAALSERRTFVAHTMTRMPFRGEMIETRTAAIERFMGLRAPKLIIATARALGIRWFVLERGDRVDWPPEIANHPVLETGPFKVYEF